MNPQADWEEIEPPYSNGESLTAGLTIDYKRFQSQSMLDCFVNDTDVIRLPAWASAPGATTAFQRRSRALYAVDRERRSVTVVSTVSAMISAGVAAVDSTGQVQVMSPTVRKRTATCSTVSSGPAGVSDVTGTSRRDKLPSRGRARCAPRAATIARGP